MAILINQKPLFIFIILFQLFTIILNLTPLSFCTKGRIGSYTGWENGGKCNLGNHINAVGSTYMYPVSINEDLFKMAQCGACYEMAGPYGAIRVRVEDYCSKYNNLCSGDIYHFNIANAGTSYIMGNANVANTTFRLVSCDYSNNVEILTNKKTNSTYLSFIVLNHNLPISYIELQDIKSNIKKNITRTQDNHWEYQNYGNNINLPLLLIIYSISGDNIIIQISNIGSEKTYKSDSNFPIPKNTYFDISTFQKINIQNNNNINNCCEGYNKADFSPIYKDGYINVGYQSYTDKATVINNSNDVYLGKYSMNIKFNNFGITTFNTSFPIKADQYTGISFSIKSKETCSNCLYIRAYDKSNNQIISFPQSNIWKNYSYSFDILGINNNEFNGIIFNYVNPNYQTNGEFEIFIENIELISNPNAPDAGVCFSNKTENKTSNNPIPPPSNWENNINSNNLFINTININENSQKVLNVKCNNFINEGNKQIVLKFISNNQGNNFDIKNCVFPSTNVISSFTCTLPDNINDDIYHIYTNTTNGMILSYQNEIEIKNGLIICGNVNSILSQYSNENYYPLIIINSKDQSINKEEPVTFNIYPIPKEKYSFDNNEIIFLNNQNKCLHLKSCQRQNIKNNIVYSIKCIISNNVMKGNFTTIYSNKRISLLDGQTINLKSSTPNGGIITGDYIEEFRSNFTLEERKKYDITFNVLYYNSNIKPGDYFPYQVILQGISKYSKKRKLDDNYVYNSKIIMEDCKAGQNSVEDSSAIGSIICHLPNYVQAGDYTKLVSEGIDMNPKNSIKLTFNKDFYGNSTIKNIANVPKPSTDYQVEKSSSKSKTWVIWVIVAVLVVFLVGLVITILACRKKNDEESSGKNANDSSVEKNNNSV